MSSVIVGAKGVTKQEISESQVQPVLLQVVVIFDCEIGDINRGNEQFKVSGMGAKLDFSSLADEIRQQANYQGVIVQKIIYVNENDTKGIDKASITIKNTAGGILAAGDVSSVDIDIYIPLSESRSLNALLLSNRLSSMYGHKHQTSAGAEYVLDTEEGVSNPAIKLRKIYEITFVDGSQPSNQKTQNPTSIDARVAVALCEYTYYISRINEYSKWINKKVNGKRKSIKDSIISMFLFGAPILIEPLKDKSIKERAFETFDEIYSLPIFPQIWKDLLKDKLFDIQDRQEETKNTELSQERTEFPELLKWEAINPETGEWLNLCKTHGDWDSSLSKAILDAINADEDNRFSFVNNKGPLNKWLLLKGEGLSSVLYINESDYELMYCVAGSDFGLDMFWNGDWSTTNILQALIGLSPQYQQSVTNALILDRAVEKVKKERNIDIKLTFIGHSLGGGLASNNAIVTKSRHAIIFNPAGLNFLRVICSLALHNRRELVSLTRGRDRVHSFIIKGEVLDTLQTGLDYIKGEMIYKLSPYKPSIRSYSLPENTKYIEVNDTSEWWNIMAKLKKSLSKHSLVNFLEPISQLKKLTI